MNHQKKKKSFILSYEDDSPEVLEFQRLYSRLKLRISNLKSHRFIVTSSSMGEGKSTASALLALTMAKAQATKTLLIDFDLRKPRIQELFDLERKNGVAEIIEAGMPARLCFKDTRFSNLKVLTCGLRSGPVSEIFAPIRIKKFFDEVKFYFNTIIIDTAPVIPVTDALIISPESNGVVFVIRAGKTPKELAKRAQTIMTDAGMNILGVVLNNVEDVLPFYYSSNYYHYYPQKKGDSSKVSSQ